MVLKTAREIGYLREAGRIAAEALRWAGRNSVPGRTTAELDAGVEAILRKRGATPEFKGYQKQVLENARAMAAVLAERGLRIVSGRTDCHMFLVDLRAKGITGENAEAALGRAHITVNKNAIPNDPEKPMVTSGVRIGSPAMTTRGMREIEAELLANLIADVLEAPADKKVLERTAGEVRKLCEKFPVYG